MPLSFFLTEQAKGLPSSTYEKRLAYLRLHRLQLTLEPRSRGLR